MLKLLYLLREETKIHWTEHIVLFMKKKIKDNSLTLNQIIVFLQITVNIIVLLFLKFKIMKIRFVNT